MIVNASRRESGGAGEREKGGEERRIEAMVEIQRRGT
jgi:hypothetical protein